MKKIVTWLAIAAVVCMSAGSAFAREVPAAASHTLSVVFISNEIPATWTKDVARLGGKVLSTVSEVGFSQIEATTATLQGLKQLPYVQAVNPSIEWKLPSTPTMQVEQAKGSTRKTQSDSLWALQWDIKRITNDGASYELSKGSHKVVVGILDTGIDAGHPDLMANLIPGSKNFVPDGPDTAFQDQNGHGTHVAGSIAGNGRMLGVAPGVGVRSYRVLDAEGSGDSAWILKGIITAAKDGCDVISMSLGGIYVHGQIWWTDPETGTRYQLGNDVADYVAYMRAMKYATEKGSLVVASAGNDAINCTVRPEATALLNAEYRQYGYEIVGAGFDTPAIIPGVVTVSATGPQDVLAVYSNYGPGFIQIAAPGGDARLYDQYTEEGRFSDYLAQKLYQTEFCLSTDIGGYSWMIGTSMAAPKVSAVAALLVDKYGELGPKQLTDLLLKQAVDAVDGNDSWYFGAGHLNAYKALGGR